ncbi:tRNA (adenosine(37)-N6)-dimethylallyltransferase MiaA [Tranquillimonas alkanivorans]|uniref:tRNA dimethylallyltransferase n=1 Tax=Tranquillimonas alkanivorans TaxID=441119 RepID=A0A1I5NVN9_9RHOB|nr:tRNA (adenosine(37)-N6)-dimethylallyltransferase MiaA [Tranquillimonas alkanivorans]SFP25690.1 tRNA dimethylallyltransferase [Tranquillimonas alkanivorans]
MPVNHDDVMASAADGRPVLIAGPTASGKSALAAEIAARHGGRIVNADALQVFADWRVLTARPSEADEAALPHALYGHVPGDAAYSVGHWLRDLAPLLSGPRPIIVGGTGLYFAALTEGLAVIPPTPPELRREADARLAEEGPQTLLDELDPETAARIDRANPVRVQRAWEVLRATGRGLARWQDETGPPLLPLRDALPVVLDTDRDWLNDRIARRFDVMLEGGALEEVRAHLPDWDPAAPSSKAIGAPELVACLHGHLTLEEARERAVVATRQYAKRQRTWFRKRMRNWQRISLPV